MTSLFHFIVRPGLLLLGLGTGAWFIFVTYFGHIGHRSHRAHPAHPVRARTFAERLFEPVDRGLHHVVQRMPAPAGVRVEAAREPVQADARPLRSTSLLAFRHPPEHGLVSVIIPSYNRANIIGRAIESALGQTYPNIQVVVADDGSVDDTQSRVEAYGPRVTYVRQANAGVSAARNFGIRQARGEFIAFLDSDDEWKPWKIEAQVAALRRHQEAGAVWTDMMAVDETGHVIDERHLRVMYHAYRVVDVEATLPAVGALSELTAQAPAEFATAPLRQGDLYDAILLGNLMHTSTALMRRSWVERTGGFDETFARAGEDYEFYVRLCSNGPVMFIDAPSTLYRVGAADQLTRPSMLLEIARNNLRAIEKWIPVSDHPSLSSSAIRRRYAEAFAWAGETELDAGHRWAAVRRISESLAVMPRLDHRTVLLVRCALPERVVDGFRGVRHVIRGRRPPGSRSVA